MPVDQITDTIGSDGKKYRLCGGTYYDQRTADEVIRVLEACRLSRARVYIRFGTTEPDPQFGHPIGYDWGDEWESAGRIGRSTGTVKIPLLICKESDCDGGGILDHCILRIARTASPLIPLYEHPQYMRPRFTTGKPNANDAMHGYIEAGYRDGELTAQFKKAGQAALWVKKMQTMCGIALD